MSKLDQLREIIEDHLRNVTMTESDRAAVRRRIAEQAVDKRKNPGYGWYLASAGMAAACILAVVLVWPSLPRAGEMAPDAESDRLVTESTGDGIGAAQERPMDSAAATTDGMSFDVLAAARTSGVVTPDTAFFIDVTGGTMAADELEARITMEPAVEFTVVPETETRYCLTPAEPLPNGEVVRLSIAKDDGSSLSWAFQTEASLQILSTLPGNEATSVSLDYGSMPAEDGTVPVETGIEINFSRIVSDGAAEHFTISPETPGAFRYYGKTLAFVPEEPLRADTVYTVTVGAGLTADSGEVLNDDYTFSFRTSEYYYSAGQYFTLANRVTESYLPGDPVSIGVTASEDLTTAQVKLWRVNSAEEYLSLAEEMIVGVHPTLGRLGDGRVETSGLPLLEEFDAEILRTETSYWYGGVSYVLLPELEVGWYLAELSAADHEGGVHTIQKLIQVHPLAIYYQSIGDETIVWVNDTTSGRTLSGVSVQLTADDVTEAVMTDASGLAKLHGCTDARGYARLEVKSDAGVYADLVETAAAVETDVAQDFRRFVYLDRAVYQPTDTVRFWGILQPIRGAALPERLDVMLSGSGEPVKVGTVEVAADGSFTGSVSFENRISGYTVLSFWQDGVYYAGAQYEVMAYQKPAYLLEAAFDQPYYRRNEEMTVHVSASFYDGTPAAGLGVSVSADTGYSLTMDENGQGETTIEPRIYQDDWRPTSQHITAMNTGSENVYVSAYDAAYYFPSDYMLTAEAVEPGALQVELLANAIDFTKVPDYLDGGLMDQDMLRGDAAVIHGTAELWGCWYEKVETGREYDPINKVSVPTYDYILHEDLLSEEQFTTDNGRSLTGGYQPQADDPYTYYRMELRYDTPDGQNFSTELALTTHFYPGNYYSGYHLVEQHIDRRDLGLGETARLQLYSTDAVSDGQLLVIPTTDRMLGYSFAEPEDVSVTFTAEMIPNVSLFCAYFDGRHIYAVQEYRLFYDRTERELAVRVETDDSSFEPGETVSGRVIVTDKDGTPVRAAYAMGVVDEAVFAISEQVVDPLSALYATRFYPAPVRYTSYVDKDLMLVYAEGGGGDGYAEARADFADTAAFLTGTTNGDGTAEFSFPLPDNLTSWRLTAAAVTEDGEAGAAKEHISVSLPFFLHLVMNDTLTAGDDVSLSARVYGAADGTAVQYTVYLGKEVIAKAGGVAGEHCFLHLGQLPTGSHEITVSAKAGDRTDGIRRTITVQESRHELMQAQSGLLTDGVDLAAVRYPVTLLLSDAEQAASMETLTTLLSMNGRRLDQTLAVYTAKSQLLALDPENPLSEELPDLSGYQHYSGGMKLFSYGDPDVMLTSLSLLTAAEHLDSAAAREYLYRVLYDRESSRYEVAAAYLGLAALREPVLSDLAVLLSDPGFTAEEQLILAEALAILGDQTGATALYETLVLPGLTRTDTWCYIENGNREAQYAATSHAAILAVLLDREEADGMIRYLQEEASQETLASFPLILRAKRAPIAPSDAGIQYVYSGETITRSLRETPVIVLEYDETALKSANFRITSGEIAYTALYMGGMDTLADTAGERIRAAISGPDTAAAGGNSVTLTTTVEFSEDCPGDSYLLDIVLPSGTRYAGYEYRHNAGYTLLAQEGSRLTFLLHRRPDERSGTARNSFSVPVSVRAVLPGSYILEEPVVRGVESGITAIGQRRNLTIS
ncbi:MAG: hypothetical protein E7458_00095 [Ruminococcaceae bacterium]|nr:hypothetical protein [Oscillospiraceae bacterium]